MVKNKELIKGNDSQRLLPDCSVCGNSPLCCGMNNRIEVEVQIKDVILQFNPSEATAIKESQTKFQDVSIETALKTIHNNYEVLRKPRKLRTLPNLGHVWLDWHLCIHTCISGCISSPGRESETIKNPLPRQNSNNAHRGRHMPNKIRPIRVTLEDEEQVRKIISKAKDIKTQEQLGTFFMSYDKTPRQQEQFRRVKKELEERKSKGEKNIKIAYSNGTPSNMVCFAFFMKMFMKLFAVITALLAVVYAYFQWNYQYWKRRGVVCLEPSFPFGHFENPLRRTMSIGDNITQIYKKVKEHGAYGQLLVDLFGVITCLGGELKRVGFVASDSIDTGPRCLL
ncbi:hypothetical protein NQ318_020828 [Aromia moschata]|uniref:Uncharacterized protein n=1 Tax=Aromia moschata TaxID=1265417 RepID=A0AAV8X2Y4_9CUCU|nr:hypothetical protein NQ318_020828 [Aromia moschata]